MKWPDDYIDKIICGDCLEVMQGIPDGAVDLVVTDPPYNIGKDTWDRRPDYVGWISGAFIGCDRVLNDRGCLWFSHMVFPLLADIHQEIIQTTDLRHVQFITIDKGVESIAGRTSASLRTFPRATEYYQLYAYEDPTGAEQLSGEIALKNPMALYLRQEIDRSGVSRKEVASIFPSKTGGLTGCVSNWLLGYNLPSVEQYEAIRGRLGKDYLRREYEDLRREYEDLRRAFNLPFGVTDVWRYCFSDGKNNGHCTEKPIGVMSRIVSASSHTGDIILDPFCGSGTTCVAAKQLGRHYIGIEINPDYCKIAEDRLRQCELFPAGSEA